MMVFDVHTPQLFGARDRDSNILPFPLPCQIADRKANLLPCADEVPDPAYWTPYDYHMMERDARAERRAYVYAIIAAWSDRLWQRVFRSAAAVRERAASSFA
jgi:hypothetical protein